MMYYLTMTILLALSILSSVSSGMDNGVSSLKELSIRAALLIPAGRDALLEPLHALKNSVPSKKRKRAPQLPTDITEDVTSFLEKNPVVAKVLQAIRNHSDPFGATAVYVYNESENNFTTEGDITSLTPKQLHTLMQKHYYYKENISLHRTRFSKLPEAIGALVLGHDPDLKQKFNTAYHNQLSYAREHLSSSQGILYYCDVPGWHALMVNSPYYHPYKK